MPCVADSDASASDGPPRIPLRRDRLSAADELALRRRLARWASRSLGLPAAEFPDIYQSAWRKLLDGERAGRPTRNREHALRWAMHNSWLEECRRRRRRPIVSLGDVELAMGDDLAAADPADELERREAARSVLNVLAELGDRAATIVLLRRMCGFSPDEVCETLGVSRRTYRAEHARAMNELQELVERPSPSADSRLPL